MHTTSRDIHAAATPRDLLPVAGYLASVSGPGGGRLACALDDITVGDVYLALAHKSVFAFGPAADNPACPVETVINDYLATALDTAERARAPAPGRWLRRG